jgi:hypothetical protein
LVPRGVFFAARLLFPITQQRLMRQAVEFNCRSSLSRLALQNFSTPINQQLAL